MTLPARLTRQVQLLLFARQNGADMSRRATEWRDWRLATLTSGKIYLYFKTLVRRLGDEDALLWEIVLADIAEAEFIEAAVSQLMQSIHHVVMTTLKISINPGRRSSG